MSFVSYFIPQEVARFGTKYNQDIRVIEESGKLKLLVNGSRQSGKYVEWLWKKTLSEFNLGSDFNNILVLGVAGGTVIGLLHTMYPDCRITGVDIDPQMIEIGKRFFGLDTIPNLTLVCADAKKFIEKKLHFDLIIVDVFTGRHIPEFVGNKKFLTTLKQRGNMAIINYLRELEYKEKSQKLQDMVEKLFPVVKNYQIAHNSFYLVVK